VPHKIALNFEDGTTQFIGADESESIADAAYRQGINEVRFSFLHNLDPQQTFDLVVV